MAISNLLVWFTDAPRDTRNLDYGAQRAAKESIAEQSEEISKQTRTGRIRLQRQKRPPKHLQPHTVSAEDVFRLWVMDFGATDDIFASDQPKVPAAAALEPTVKSSTKEEKTAASEPTVKSYAKEMKTEVPDEGIVFYQLDSAISKRNKKGLTLRITTQPQQSTCNFPVGIVAAVICTMRKHLQLTSQSLEVPYEAQIIAFKSMMMQVLESLGFELPLDKDGTLTHAETLVPDYYFVSMLNTMLNLAHWDTEHPTFIGFESQKLFILYHLQASFHDFYRKLHRFKNLWYWEQLCLSGPVEDINRDLPLPEEQRATTFTPFDKTLPEPHPSSRAALTPGFNSSMSISHGDTWVETHKPGVWIKEGASGVWGIMQARQFVIFQFIATNNVWYCQDFGIVIPFRKGKVVYLRHIMNPFNLDNDIKGEWMCGGKEPPDGTDPMWRKAWYEIVRTRGEEAPLKGKLGNENETGDDWKSLWVEEKHANGETVTREYTAFFSLADAGPEGSETPADTESEDTISDVMEY